MKLEQFVMERMQSTWENIVKFNLSESGVHPVALGELVPSAAGREELLTLELGYGQSNGTADLRNTIAEMYQGADDSNVLVTTGTSEANFLATWSIVEPGDEVIMILPNYMQTWGVARGFGGQIKEVPLIEEMNWAPDLDEFESLLSSKTKLIIVCNPNNPTGAILTEAEMDRITEGARRVGAWLLADEVYRGAERERPITPSFWGRYEKVIVTAGLSKAYGLPGLRIGWIVGPSEIVTKAWSYHDYTTIGPSALSDRLARVALAPDNRRKLLARTREILNNNFPVLRKWVDSYGGMFSVVEPQAGAIAYLRYDLDMESLDFVERLRDQKSVLLVPGEHFHMKNYLRVGFGSQPEHLREALELISSFVSDLP
ncbi:MAG: aspartate aminotransferase [Blastocatellia bacterium AA13]|nr:MAG: aspartate aminotransferase [Blastocatellia bacterium AA13]